jgi:hypothetical protein
MKEKSNLLIQNMKHVRICGKNIRIQIIVKSVKTSDLHLISCRHHGILRSKNVPLVPLKGLEHAVIN